jgi:hypothetical protein
MSMVEENKRYGAGNNSNSQGKVEFVCFLFLKI